MKSMMKFWGGVATVATLFSSSAFAETPYWSCSTEGEVLWQRSATFGYFIASTKKGLCGIDVDKGTVLWTSAEYAGIDEDNVMDIAGTPYCMISQRNESVIIDGLTGTKAFSAKAQGFSSVTKRQPLYRCGGLLVIGKKGDSYTAMMANMSDGAKRWEVSGLDSVYRAFEIGNNSVLLVTSIMLYRIDVATGKQMWGVASIRQVQGLDKSNAFDNALFKLAKKFAEKSPMVAMDVLIDEGRDVFYVGTESKQPQDVSSGKKSWTNYYVQCAYNAYKLSDGSAIWKSPFEYAGKLGKLIMEEKGLLLFDIGKSLNWVGQELNLPEGTSTTLYDNYGSKVNLLSFTDGVGTWGKKGQGLDLEGQATLIFKNEKGYICVTDKAVNILDVKSGTFQLKSNVNIFSDIQDVQMLPCGLFACSDDECTIIDLETKKPLWKKPIKTAPGLYSMKDNTLYVYSTKEKIVYKADLAAQVALTPLSGEIKFSGKEKPTRLECRSNGILLSSDQNFMLIAPDGKTVFSVYFEAPRESAMTRALLYANAARAAYYGTRYGMASVQLKDIAEKSDNPFEKGMAGTFGEITGAVSNAAFDATGDCYKKAGERFKATSQTDDCVFVMTKKESGCALLQVNKSEGKTLKTIELGNDKKPIYSVDSFSGKVFYRAEPKKIVCYTM